MGVECFTLAAYHTSVSGRQADGGLSSSSSSFFWEGKLQNNLTFHFKFDIASHKSFCTKSLVFVGKTTQCHVVNQLSVLS